jgi:hypothetical protein
MRTFRDVVNETSRVTVHLRDVEVDLSERTLHVYLSDDDETIEAASAPGQPQGSDYDIPLGAIPPGRYEVEITQSETAGGEETLLVPTAQADYELIVRDRRFNN